MAKQPRKVALIDVRDYPRDKYSAYWVITVAGEEGLGYRWQVDVHSYTPVAWDYKGKVTTDRPDVPQPVYPPDIQVKQPQFLKMTKVEQAEIRRQQEARRQQCAAIYEANPKPVFNLAQQIGTTDTRDEADTAAQTWVKAEMEKYKKPELAPAANPQAGFALALGPGGMLIDALFEGLRRLFLPLILMAVAYNTTLRNNRMAEVRDFIDAGAGAGLWRIYDGSRPATCGTATTLLAELTCSDPSAGAPSGGVLTFSAITADSSANATGTATWFRIVDSTGTCCVDGNVGTSGSDLNLNSTSISSGQEVSITAASITEGNA
jgi:hypothetical protein